MLDVALDTFPYAGTTTTAEALLMGVPVVSLLGNAHVQRASAALLARAGVAGWAAADAAAFVRTAVEVSAEVSEGARRELRARVVGVLGESERWAACVEREMERAFVQRVREGESG